LEDRLPTETFPPDLEELLLPFETDELELLLLTELLGFEVVLGTETELLELEVGLTARELELLVLPVVAGFWTELLDDVEAGFTVREVLLPPLLCTALPLDCGFTLLFTVVAGLLVVATREEVVVLLPDVLAGELCTVRESVLTEPIAGLLALVFTLWTERLVVPLVAGFTALVFLV
jgi:hypothetical protein